jgi:hypothetical protein
MKRLLVLSLILLATGTLSSPATAKLKKGELSKLQRWMTVWLDPFQDDETRAKALKEITDFFDNKRMGQELADVETLSQLLGASAKRDRVRGGSVLERSIDLSKLKIGRKYDYAVSVPGKYSGTDSADPWPMIICLPGKDLNPAAYIEKHWKNEAVRDEYVIVALSIDYSDITETEEVLEKDEETGKWVDKVVTKEIPFTWSNRVALEKFWQAYLGLLIREFKVDPNRVVLDGAGMGADGVLNIASGTTWRFAGIIVRGGTVDPGNRQLSNLNYLPVLVMPDDKAPAVSEALSKILPDSLTTGTSGPDWTGAEEGEAAEMHKWLAGAVRKRYPLPSTWTGVRGAHVEGYWCFVSGRFSEEAPFEVTISSDRKKNRVELTTTNVATMTLYLNDQLVDLDKEFTVTVNGKDLGAFTQERSAELMVKHSLIGHDDGRLPRDPGCVFSAEVELKIPAPPAPAESEKKAEGDGGSDEGKPDEGTGGEDKPGGDKPDEGSAGEGDPGVDKPGSKPSDNSADQPSNDKDR